jgi:hypothetical protein
METKMADSDEDWIKRRAYELWEAEGYPTGKDSEHWEQARLEYATMKPVAGTSSSSRRKADSGEAPLAVKAAAKSTSKTPAKSPAKPETKTGAETAKGKVTASKANSSETAERPAPPMEEPVKKRAKKVSAGK